MKQVYVRLLIAALMFGSTNPVQSQEEKPGRFNILVNGEIPVGEFSNAVTLGFGGFVQITRSLSSVPELGIGVAVGAMRFPGKEVSSLGGKAPGLTAVPILITAQYTFETEGKVKPYLQTGIGLYHLRASSGSFNGFGVAPGGGVLIPIKPDRTWFRVEGAFHIVEASYIAFNTATFASAGGSIRSLQIQAGISTAFGG